MDEPLDLAGWRDTWPRGFPLPDRVDPADWRPLIARPRTRTERAKRWARERVRVRMVLAKWRKEETR